MTITCCPPTPCCIGTVTKDPADQLKVRIDMQDWVAAGGTILHANTAFAITDVTDNVAAPPAPAGVGIVAGSTGTETGEDGLQSILAFGIEGGTDGHTYRIDITAEVRDCDGFVERKKFCVTVQVANNV